MTSQNTISKYGTVPGGDGARQVGFAVVAGTVVGVSKNIPENPSGRNVCSQGIGSKTVGLGTMG